MAILASVIRRQKMARKKRKVAKKKPVPTNKRLYSAVKAQVKRKFKVYPSAYANMYGSAVCSGKVTPGGKKKKKPKKRK
jgi:hypothetical protein